MTQHARPLASTFPPRSWTTSDLIGVSLLRGLHCRKSLFPAKGRSFNIFCCRSFADHYAPKKVPITITLVIEYITCPILCKEASERGQRWK